MKKLMIAFAAVAMAACANAAAVGWSNAGLGSYTGDKYQMFVIGQNGVENVATVTALLSAGSSADSYAFGGGTVAGNGTATVMPANSGKKLDAGTYTAFMVLFDAATPKKGDTKYAVIEGGNNGTGYTINIGGTTANASFIGGNVGALIKSWKDYGDPEPTPEPTSAMLMLLGVAGLALRRKQK